MLPTHKKKFATGFRSYVTEAAVSNCKHFFCPAAISGQGPAFLSHVLEQLHLLMQHMLHVPLQHDTHNLTAQGYVSLAEPANFFVCHQAVRRSEIPAMDVLRTYLEKGLHKGQLEASI